MSWSSCSFGVSEEELECFRFLDASAAGLSELSGCGKLWREETTWLAGVSWLELSSSSVSADMETSESESSSMTEGDMVVATLDSRLSRSVCAGESAGVGSAVGDSVLPEDKSLLGVSIVAHTQRLVDAWSSKGMGVVSTSLI